MPTGQRKEYHGYCRHRCDAGDDHAPHIANLQGQHGSVTQTPSSEWESLGFLLSHMLWPLGKKLFSSFGDFYLKMKLLEGGYASYCYCETKFESISPSYH